MNNLRKVRLEKNITLTKAASLLGISRTGLFDAEMGVVSVNLAEKAAKVFNVNLFEILGQDVFKALPKNEHEKQIIAEILKNVSN